MHACSATALSIVGALVTPLLSPGLLGQAAGIERAVARAEAMGVRTGVAVLDADAAVLYRHRAAESFAPASNMKLLTAAGVLSELGRDYEFVTRFRLEQGALCVEASGDPKR